MPFLLLNWKQGNIPLFPIWIVHHTFPDTTRNTYCKFNIIIYQTAIDKISSLWRKFGKFKQFDRLSILIKCSNIFSQWEFQFIEHMSSTNAFIYSMNSNMIWSQLCDNISFLQVGKRSDILWQVQKILITVQYQSQTELDQSWSELDQFSSEFSNQ